MFAWILKMKPENSDRSGGIDVPAMTGAAWARANVLRKPSSNSCTPKLLTALPKKHGRDLAGENGGFVKGFPGRLEHLQFLCDLVSRSFVQPARE